MTLGASLGMACLIIRRSLFQVFVRSGSVLDPEEFRLVKTPRRGRVQVYMGYHVSGSFTDTDSGSDSPEFKWPEKPIPAAWVSKTL